MTLYTSCEAMQHLQEYSIVSLSKLAPKNEHYSKITGPQIFLFVMKLKNHAVMMSPVSAKIVPSMTVGQWLPKVQI